MRKLALFMFFLLTTARVLQSEEEALAEKLVISSPEFKYGGFIPSKYTCDGENINPPLRIECIPKGTKSLVLFIEDMDSLIGVWVHSVWFNIPPSETIENSLSGVMGTNDFNQQSYNGPCPSTLGHTYVFTVYALDTFLNLNSDAKKPDVEKAMEGHILAKGKLEGIYCKNNRFSMDITPLKVSVKRGESAEFQIHTAFCNPTFEKTPIRFFVSDLHSSMGWSITPENNLIIESSSETPPGIYWFRLLGEAREYSTTDYAALIIRDSSQESGESKIISLKEAQETRHQKEWPQFGGNSQYTFFSSTTVPDRLKVRWKYDVGSSDEGRIYNLCSMTSPAVVGTRVYIQDFDHLYCINLLTGNLIYEVPADTMYPYTPTVADGKIYISEGDHFKCLDAGTGDILWEKELPQLLLVSPFVDSNYVYVTADQSSSSFCSLLPCIDMVVEWSVLMALNKDTGEEVWRYSVDGIPAQGLGFPTGADGSIFFFFNSYESDKCFTSKPEKSGIACLDARTGALTWKRESILPPPSCNTLYPFWMTYYKKNLYIGGRGVVFCVDVKTQEVVWNHEIPALSPALSVGNGVIVVRGFLQADCLDAETGEELWTKPLGGTGMSVMSGSDVFIEDWETLYRVDIKSGNIKESYNVDEFINTAVTARGNILVVTEGDTLYCLGGPGFTEVILAAVAVAIVAVLTGRVIMKSQAI
ncbi:MAG: YbhB/YbcL family Raf kinase inhibitor-like protein [Theionarchaea archaeon]|nr:YbhB/YbcL family Raf kinase inhibitor-like protein [Theionarchaea archaeon]